MLKQVVAFVVSIAIAFIPSLVGNMVGQSAWYDELDKPPLQPPGATFGIVWTALYFATGVALFLIWRSSASNKQMAYGLFAIHMVLNSAWTLVFFGLEQSWLALVVLVLLLATILACIIHFRGISQWASNLFIPYAAWVAFATYLNIGILWLN